MTLGIICWAGPDGEDERGSSRGFMRGRAEKSMVLETTLHLSSNANRSLASRDRPVLHLVPITYLTLYCDTSHSSKPSFEFRFAREI